MTVPIFDSWKEYGKFCLCREFVDQKTGEPFEAPPSYLEKAGHYLSTLVMRPVDFAIREFRNPMVIVALTIISIVITSVIFYPAYTIGILYTIFPFLKAIGAEHVKGALFILSQSLILGLGLRAYGRLSNPELMEAYRAKEIIPISIGSVRL